jgi:hypothetical protein
LVIKHGVIEKQPFSMVPFSSMTCPFKAPFILGFHLPRMIIPLYPDSTQAGAPPVESCV